MEKELNIAEILVDKPKGTKLYADAFGELSLDCIKDNEDNSIYVRSKAFTCLTFYSDGKYTKYGEPILVPSKGMQDWLKFAWKKGDVLVSNDGCVEVIFDKWYDDTYTSFYGKHYLNSEYANNIRYIEAFICTTERYSLEDNNAAQCYINTIEERLGGKLNRETLEIEPVKPKHVFKPLEYVLSNDNEDNEWTLCQFSHFDKKGNTVFVGGSYADKGKVILPYKGNEHLLGTTNSLE